MRDNGFNLSNASFWIPDYLTSSAWLAHAPFAFWLTEALRPKRIVELGTHSGFSFFALCQAIARLDLGTRAFAIGTWKGDEHGDLYGNDMFERVHDRNKSYRGFATILRMTPDAALENFEDRSIDVLHIDGLRFYEDVAHDFAAWRSKLTPEAVVLFHNTEARERELGVRKLWEELSATHPSFEFVHGHGLGVLCPSAVPVGLMQLIGSGTDVQAATRAAYEALGAAVIERQRGIALASGLNALLAKGDKRSTTDHGLAPDIPNPNGLDLRLIRPDRMRAATGEAGPDVETAIREAIAGEHRQVETEHAKIEGGRWRDDAELRAADLAASQAEMHAGLRATEATSRLLRRSLSARIDQIKRLRHTVDLSGDRSSMLADALVGQREKHAHEQQIVIGKYDEILRWGQRRQDYCAELLARLNETIAALSDANQRLHHLERSRLVRSAARIARLRDRLPQSRVVPVSHDDVARRAAAVRNTGLFDEAYYRETNPDVGADVVDAASHFAETGWWEGRWPNPGFDPGFYLAQNRDVAEMGENPLIHYAERGILENRKTSASMRPSRWIRPSDEVLHPDDIAAVEAVLDTGLFDGRYYRETYADVTSSGIEPVLHFALDGWREGRRPNARFDPAFYLTTYPDVAASGENPLVHYATAGILEGRAPSREALTSGPMHKADSDAAIAETVLETGLFDIEYYRASYPDVPSTDDAALHFARHGWKEGRKPNEDFEPATYLSYNPDVAALGINPLLHFSEHGLLERRPFLSPVDFAGDGGSPVADYTRWVDLYDTLTEEDRRAIRARLLRLQCRPLISVVMPVYNPQIRFLRQAVASVQSQLYPNWELCVADDASPDPTVRDALREMAEADPRIKLVMRPENGHISAASNSALALASGEFVALMDHDDILPDHALFEVAAALNDNPDLDIIYSDEDHIDDKGRRNTPYFKSDFNPDIMLGHNLISHLGVYRRALLERIDGFRLGFEGSQDYDLALRAMDASAPERIHHIPTVLYHWRSGTGADTFSEASLQRCIAAARRAIADHMERRGHAGEVVAHPTLPSWQRVRRLRPEPAPLVSVIVPTKDRAELVGPCVDGLLHRTEYPNIEVLIVDHQSTEPSALALFAELSRDPRVRVLLHEGPFNYSAINNEAVERARGPLLALLNNDIDVIEPGWLDEMVALAVLPEVGAVGAKLLYPDDRVQHAGVILGSGGVANHSFHRLGAQDPGYFGRAALASTVAAVTAACLVVRRSVFDEVGGFDVENLPVAFNDVDLCLKIRARGYRNVWTPHACLYHHESVSRGSDLEGERFIRFQREVEFMRHKWGEDLDNDPFYNPNLDLSSAHFGLAFPPRRQKPWRTSNAVG